MIIAFDGINRVVEVGDEVAHLTRTGMKIGIVKQIRRAGHVNGEAVTKSWKEVKLTEGKRWVRADRVVRTGESK